MPAADANEGALATNATWGLGPATYDLNHNGNPISDPIGAGDKIGNFIAGSASFQEVAFDSCFTSADYGYGHLYQWQNGNWVEQWKTEPILGLCVAQPIIGDFEHNGRLEVAAQPFFDIRVYDLLTGTLKSSARVTPDDVLTGREYGWVGAYDLNGDGTQEIVSIGTVEKYIAVMGWQNGQLVKLWDHTIEILHQLAQTIQWAGEYPVQDIDGDGMLDVVTSIYNESGDGQWHVVARDGLTGNVLLDQPGRFLVGMADVNGDGVAEMLTMATSGELTPDYGQVDVVSFRGRTLTTLLELNGVGLATQVVESLPLNINTNDQLTALVAGPIAKGGLPVFFTRRVVDASHGTTELTPWQWSNGAFAKLGTITGPNLQVLATRLAVPGSPSFLVTAAVDGNSAGNITVSGVNGTIVQSSLIPAPLSSALVGHLRPGDPPTVIVQNALEELVAFRPLATSGGATVLWTHPGRGGQTGSPSVNGQYGFSGPLLASLTGDGTLQTIAATRVAAGQARMVAIQPDGSDLWTSDLSRFPGAPPASNESGLTLFNAGRFRNAAREDVLVATRKGTNNELNLLDGSTGQLLWNDPKGSTPGTIHPPGQDAAGGALLAVYDWNHEGLDDIVSISNTTYWVKDGMDKNLIDRNFSPEAAATGGLVFQPDPSWPPGSFPISGVPVIADFLNNGTDTILFGGSAYLLGLMDANGKGIWNDAYQAGTPGFLQGIADLDGDGTLSLVSAGATGSNGQSVLNVQKSSTGELLWSIPLPGCGRFAAGGFPTLFAPTPVTTGDINGDGRDEAVFACGSKIYVAGADPGNRSGKILWSLDLGTMLDTPILADAEGNGRLEIVVVGANGYVYGIGSQPSSSPPAANAPVIAANGIVEGATLRPGQIAPGGWFAIEGTNLSDGKKYQAAATPLPQQLGGTVVTVNGQIARLTSVDTGQINAEMPPDMPVGSASVVVTTKAGSSKSASVQIVPAMPEILQYGANRAVAQNAPDDSLNGPDNAIPAGGSLVVYFTGGGLVNGDRRTGVPAPLTTLMQTSLATTVTIGGQQARLAFSGLTPGSIGLYEAHVTVPAALSPGDYPVTITVGGVTSSPALISVK